jgi:tetratricopeptide (TPR) repeat protein
MSEAPRGGHDSRFGKDPQASSGQEAAETGAGAQVTGAGGRRAADAADEAPRDEGTGDGPEAGERDAGQEAPQASGGHQGPGGDSYAWYRRGLDLLSRGSPAAAAELLERAAEAEPGARSIREALARAQFDAGRYAQAADNFRQNVEAIPSDDYAHFGLGLALARGGDPAAAAEHLALAAAMRPELSHYTEALRGVRATLAARSRAGDVAPPPPAPDGDDPR